MNEVCGPADIKVGDQVIVTLKVARRGTVIEVRDTTAVLRVSGKITEVSYTVPHRYIGSVSKRKTIQVLDSTDLWMETKPFKEICVFRDGSEISLSMKELEEDEARGFYKLREIARWWRRKPTECQ